jgi:hypothetical protein
MEILSGTRYLEVSGISYIDNLYRYIIKFYRRGGKQCVTQKATLQSTVEVKKSKAIPSQGLERP